MSSAMQSNSDKLLAGQSAETPAESTVGHVCTIAPMVAKSQEAFRRELPELLRRRHGWWVAYHGDERIGFAQTEIELVEECLRRGLTEDQFIIQGILPDAADEDVEIITPWA